MKGKITALMTCALLLCAMLSQVALADAPALQKVEYEGRGRVGVDFRQDVKYAKPAVRVKDEDGKQYEAKIVKRDDDDLTFTLSAPVAGKKYAFEISGVRARGTSGYGSVTGTFSIPAPHTIAVKSLDYDHGDRELSFDFTDRVKYKKVKVVVKDAQTGKAVSARVIDKDADELTVRLSRRLVRGNTYQYSISGVAPRSGGSAKTLTGTFLARDD